ncbi:MAG: response regulator [Candidatus Eremiobacteraeota bacterium]|nr:response regulator [Candidatus Eremiobacteraeota bacterium]
MNRVMVVDDYEPNLQLYSAIVRRVIGEEALTYDDPAEALRSLIHERPDFIVVDYQMPEMNGIAFISAVRTMEGHARTPVIMLTGVNDRSIRVAAMAAGATHYMEKPVALRDFTAHIRRYTAASRREPELTGGSMADHNRDTIVRLHRAVQARDAALAERMRRTAELAVDLASELHVAAVEIESLRTASLVYDLGMLSVPEEVLQSGAALTKHSRSVVQNHASAGAAILGGGHSTLMHAAESIARSHHERYDGGGYPDKLLGDAIPLLARIIAIADTYTALTSPRPYREEQPAHRALAEIEAGSATAFDPSIVAALMRIRDRVAENRYCKLVPG